MGRVCWSAALAVVILAGCTTAASGQPTEGIVTGRLIAVGGPAPGAARPLSGVVKLKGSDGKTVAVDVDADGTFRIRARTGSYSLSGSSPQYGSGRYPCIGVDRAGEVVDQLDLGAAPVSSDVVCSMK
jgi:hypothetical protein